MPWMPPPGGVEAEARNQSGRGVSQGLDLLDLRRLAEKEGFRTLFQDGMDKARQGITTFSEVIRVSRGSENGLV